MGTTEKSISKNFVFNFIKTGMSMLFPIITFTYASRILSVEGIGKINFTKSIVTYFVLLAQLGMYNYGTREAAKIRNNKDKLSKFTQEMMLINGVATVVSYILFEVKIIKKWKRKGYGTV